MSGTYNIEIDEESDFSVRFVYIETSTGLPYDLTGARAEMHVRRLYNGYADSDIKLKFGTDDGSIIVGGASGTIDVFIPYTTTLNRDWESGVYSLFIMTAQGKRVKYMSGFFTIIPSAVKLSQTELADISSTKTPPILAANNFGAGGIPSPASS